MDRLAADAALLAATSRNDIPGVVALAADRGGIVYESAFGRLRIDSDALMQTDTLFRIASMTKAVTSVAAMQLVERDLLQLDQPLGDIVPGLAAPQVLEGFDASGQPRLRPARRPLTLRHLLTHTSGFTYDIFNAEMSRYVQQAGLPSVLSRRLAALDMPLLFDPGERWEYGISTDWVGRLVEIVSGQSLAGYLAANVFAPLGMTDATFAPDSAQAARLAAVHARYPDESLVPLALETPADGEFDTGGGGLYASGADYIAFVQMLLHGGSFRGARILRTETIAEMSRNQIGALEVPMLRSANPQLAREVDAWPGMVKKWGLGFLINTETAPTGRAAGSLAWAGVYNTYYWVDPTTGVAGVVLMQLLPANDAKALEVFQSFERAVYV